MMEAVRIVIVTVVKPPHRGGNLSSWKSALIVGFFIVLTVIIYEIEQMAVNWLLFQLVPEYGAIGYGLPVPLALLIHAVGFILMLIGLGSIFLWLMKHT